MIDVDLLPLKKRADEGDPKAQYEMAWACWTGKGMSKDIKQAIQYFKKMVQRSHLELAEYGYNFEVLLISIGMAYADLGITDKAIKWYKNALWFMVEHYTEEYKDMQIKAFNLRRLIKTGLLPWSPKTSMEEA